MNPFIRVNSGGKVYLLRPTADSLLINDVAHALSQIVRFTGHCVKPYTVAQHCCHCCDVAPSEHKLCVLMHDAQEAWVNDLAKPLKECLPQYQEIEGRFEKLVARKWKMPYPRPAIVGEIDNRMLVTEMKYLVPGAEYKTFPFAPYDMKLTVWSHDKARREFLERFHKLFGGHKR